MSARCLLRHSRMPALLALAFGLQQAPAALAQLDPASALVKRLDNGLTLIVLEERSLPSVSVQMLYRVGARDENPGETGIAHFLEHMAFRATENFPDTEVVSRIYAAGGEWHGYTWIDQTTYFATVPRDHLDLLLRIEADRMTRLEIDPAMVDPERGSVLAEMHGYENDPASVLHDQVVFTALQAHPYRNNTIGWESDVRAIGHADLVAFYRQHYVPANAVLAVVGDVDAGAVQTRVAELFGDLPVAAPTPLPRTVEPPQNGARQIELLGAGADAYLGIAWQAPGVNDPDFAAFLLLQEWLGGSDGVNFMESIGAAHARPGTLLHGLAADIRTWFPPSAQNYLFTIEATVPGDSTPERLEADIERAVTLLRETAAEPARLAALKQRVLAELVLDVTTHEDAAHQLAFYDGLGALERWRRLPDSIAAVDAAELQSVARRWLQPQQRTIGYYRAGVPPAAVSAVEATTDSTAVDTDTEPPVDVRRPVVHAPASGGVDTPGLTRLDSGLPVIVQRSGLSPTVHVRVVLNAAGVAGGPGIVSDDPVWGAASLGARGLPQDLPEIVGQLRVSFDLVEAVAPGVDQTPSEDPATRLEEAYRALLALDAVEPGAPSSRPHASLVVVAGDVDTASATELVARHFGDAPYQPVHAGPPPTLQPDDPHVELPVARAQAQVGYAVPAPPPASEEFPAWRALLYILTHGYEGRLGKAAISERGLAYYVDGQYRSNGQGAWIAISTGVDPDKLEPLAELYRATLAELATKPPTEAEVAEARSHFLGRLATARQSNEELTAGLAQEWLWFGRLRSTDERRAAIEAIDREGVVAAVAGFTAGRTAVVAVGEPRR